jgi:hypothetical protein
VKRTIILISAGLAVAVVVVVALSFRQPKPIHLKLSSFEQSYLKKGDLFIRKHGARESDVLFLLTADKDAFYRWRNWRGPTEKSKGGLIFPEAFIVALYDASGFDITSLKIPSTALDHRDDVDASTIVLGCTQRAPLPYSDAKRVHSFKVSFLYEVK